MNNLEIISKTSEVEASKTNLDNDALVDVFIDIIIDSFLEKRSKSVTKSDTITLNSN